MKPTNLKNFILWTVLVVCMALPVRAGEPEVFSAGGFAASPNDGGSWVAGAPSCFGADFASKVKGAALDGGKADHLKIQLSDLEVAWSFDDAATTIPLVAPVAGAKIELDVQGYGTLASSANLDVYNDQSKIDGLVVSFLSGLAKDSLPDDKKYRIVGASVASADVKLGTLAEGHALADLKLEKAQLFYGAVTYILESSASSTIKSAADLKDVKSVVFLGLRCELEDDKVKVYEARWIGDAPAAYATGASATIGEIGSQIGLNASLTTSSLKLPQAGSIQKISIPASTINDIVNIGLTDDLDAVRVGAPGGNMLLADLPAFTLPVPGLAEGLRFSKSRLTLTLGSSHSGKQFGFSIDAGLDNVGTLLGPLGKGITGSKRVSLTVEGSTIVINFQNSLEDLKPLGFSLHEPTVSIDLDHLELLLSGSLQLPQNLPIPLEGDRVDVVCELSQTNMQFMLISSVELPIFNDRIRLSLDTLALGMANSELYFMSAGRAYFTEDVSMMQGIDAFKKIGLDLTVGAEISAEVFFQTDGTVHVELLTKDLLKLSAGPVDTSLDEVKFVLDHQPNSPWVASIAGQASLDINQGIFSLHATTRASLSTDGTIKIEVPDDPENPTRIAIGELEVVLNSGEFLVAKDENNQYAISIDAVATTVFPKAIPLIGGQELQGHIAAKSDGSFLMEVTKVPGLEFQGMRVGLTTLKVENKKVNNSFLLSFEAGAGVEFLPDFVMPPLRNEKVTGSILVSSDLTVKMTLNGLVLNIGDFRFGIEEMYVGLIKGRDITVGGTAVLEVQYPSSKYLGIGLPAALAGADTGPSFDIRGSVNISATNVYFQARSDSMEIPIDIPMVFEGATIRVEQIGAGITYNGVPLFDLKGALYLPDFDGKGKTGVTPTLERPYDSKLALKLAGNVQEGIVAALETEGDPKIAIKPVFEFTLREAGVSTWLYGCAIGIDLSTRIKIGDPDAGFGTLFDLQEGHLTLMQLYPSPIYLLVPFYDKCTAQANIGGFGMSFDSEFPRPQLIDIGTIMDVVQYIQAGQVEEIFNQCGRGGKFNALFPRFSMSDAKLMIPKAVAKTLNTQSELNLLAAVGGKIDINSGDIVPLLPPLVKAISNPKDTLANIVSSIPKKRRKGKIDIAIGVGNFNLLSGNVKYDLQAREKVFYQRNVPKLANILKSLEIINAAEAAKGQHSHQHWELVKKDGGFVAIKNRNSNKCMTVKFDASKENGVNVMQKGFTKDHDELLWSTRTVNGATRAFYNRLTSRTLSYDADNVCQWETTDDGKSDWLICPVYGTKFVRLMNADGKVIAVAGGSTNRGANVALEDLPASETVTGNGTSVTIEDKALEVEPTLKKVKSFVDRLKLSENTTSEQLMGMVRSSGSSVTGDSANGLTVKVSNNVSAFVSPFGRVQANVAGGTLDLRTTLANAPQPALFDTLDALKLDTVAGMGKYPVPGITTTRYMKMGNPDFYAARTWKLLWAQRDPAKRPSISGTTIRLPLKNGVIAKMKVTAKCRVIGRIPITYQIPVVYRSGLAIRIRMETRTKYVNLKRWGNVNNLQITSSGQVRGRYASSAYTTGYYTILSPSGTNAKGAPGLQRVTFKTTIGGLVPTGGFESRSLDPKFNFELSDAQGWKAKVETTKVVTLTSPANESYAVALLSGALEEQMASIANGGNTSLRTFAKAGTFNWYLAEPDGSVSSGSTEDVLSLVEETGKQFPASRRLTWTQSSKNMTARVNQSGGLAGVHGLHLENATTSVVNVSRSGIKHVISVGRIPVKQELTKDNVAAVANTTLPPENPYGPYQAKVFLVHEGQQYPVKVLDEAAGKVNDPGFTNIPMGLDLSGKMQIGDKSLISTMLQFAGHIDEDGGVALGANGEITIRGFKLANSEFSFKHYPNGKDNGLTFSGSLRAPFEGHIEGEIFENGNFHASGSIKMFVPGITKTGFQGEIVIDPQSSWIKANVYVGGTKVLYTSTEIKSSNKHIKITNQSGFNIGVGGYYKKVLWWTVWVKYSGVKGGLKTEVKIPIKKNAGFSARLYPYLQAWLLDKSLGKVGFWITIPDPTKLRHSKVLGRRLDWRIYRLYLKWDAPWPVSDPRIGSL